MSDDNGSMGALAKFGERGLETLEKAGAWLDGVVGDGFRELGGAWADSVAGFRYVNKLKVLKRTQEKIEAAGLQDHVRRLSARVAVPLLEAISDESDETLQDVWATYIRNAVDPSKSNPDRLLIDVIRRLEPSDWPILQILFASRGRKLTSNEFSLPEVDLSEALDRLTAIGLLNYEDDRNGYVVENHQMGMLTVSCANGAYSESRLLAALQRATETTA